MLSLKIQVYVLAQQFFVVPSIANNFILPGSSIGVYLIVETVVPFLVFVYDKLPSNKKRGFLRIVIYEAASFVTIVNINNVAFIDFFPGRIFHAYILAQCFEIHCRPGISQTYVDSQPFGCPYSVFC